MEDFNKKILEFDEVSIKPMFIDSNGVIYFHLRHNNLIFLAVANSNVNATLIFSFIYKLIDILTEYFKELEEESVRDNFCVIYELLDEIMDNGLFINKYIINYLEIKTL